MESTLSVDGWRTESQEDGSILVSFDLKNLGPLLHLIHVITTVVTGPWRSVLEFDRRAFEEGETLTDSISIQVREDWFHRGNLWQFVIQIRVAFTDGDQQEVITTLKKVMICETGQPPVFEDEIRSVES